MKRFPALLLTLLLIYYFISLSPIAHASITYWNRTAFPEGTVDEFNNWEFRDAAGYCFRAKGRTFVFSGTSSFPLSGLSALVMVNPSNETRFNPSDFRLTLYKLGSAGSPIINRQMSSFSRIIQRESDGSITYDLYFPASSQAFFDGTTSYQGILECLTDDESLYRVWESKDLKTGSAKYYNSVTFQEEAYYDDKRQILFSLFRPKYASVFLNPSSPSTNLALTSSTPTTPPKFHPIIFVHGMGGRPENWQDDSKGMNYKKMFLDQGYPENYLHFYSYGIKNGQYNYQGDITEIAQNLESVVNSLSTLHKAQGGDGRVDIVGHSL